MVNNRKDIEMDKRLKESVLTQLGYGIDTLDDAQKTYQAIARLWDEGDPSPTGFKTEPQLLRFYTQNSDLLWSYAADQAADTHPLAWLSTRQEFADVFHDESFKSGFALIALRDAIAEMLVDGLVGAQQ